ncbi:hypothetical protein D3C72_1416770 [compost metagenome]
MERVAEPLDDLAAMHQHHRAHHLGVFGRDFVDQHVVHPEGARQVLGDRGEEGAARRGRQALGQLGQGVFQPLLLGDVAGHADHAHQLAIGRVVGVLVGLEHPLGGAAADEILDRARLLRGEHLLVRLGEAQRGLLRKDLRVGAAENGLARAAHGGGGGGVREEVAALAVLDEDGLGGVIDDGPQVDAVRRARREGAGVVVARAGREGAYHGVVDELGCRYPALLRQQLNSGPLRVAEIEGRNRDRHDLEPPRTLPPHYPPFRAGCKGLRPPMNEATEPDVRVGGRKGSAGGRVSWAC